MPLKCKSVFTEWQKQQISTFDFIYVYNKRFAPICMEFFKGDEQDPEHENTDL